MNLLTKHRSLIDVLFTMPERRHSDREYVQSVEEVFAESPLCDVAFEVAGGRGDHPPVNLDGARPAQAIELPVLKDSQQFGL